jgi:hypothetical protein
MPEVTEVNSPKPAIATPHACICSDADIAQRGWLKATPSGHGTDVHASLWSGAFGLPEQETGERRRP